MIKLDFSLTISIEFIAIHHAFESATSLIVRGFLLIRCQLFWLQNVLINRIIHDDKDDFHLSCNHVDIDVWPSVDQDSQSGGVYTSALLSISNFRLAYLFWGMVNTSSLNNSTGRMPQKQRSRFKSFDSLLITLIHFKHLFHNLPKNRFRPKHAFNIKSNVQVNHVKIRESGRSSGTEAMMKEVYDSEMLRSFYFMIYSIRF